MSHSNNMNRISAILPSISRPSRIAYAPRNDEPQRYVDGSLEILSEGDDDLDYDMIETSLDDEDNDGIEQDKEGEDIEGSDAEPTTISALRRPPMNHASKMPSKQAQQVAARALERSRQPLPGEKKTNRSGPREIPVPAHQRHLITATAEEAVTTCPRCDKVQQPYLVIGGGYFPRKCICQLNEQKVVIDRRVAEQKEQEELVRRGKIEDFIAHQMQIDGAIEGASSHRYTWLGEDFSEDGLELMSFKNFVRDTPERQEAFEQFKNYIADPTPVLVVTGPPGVGKTHLLAALTNYYCNQYGKIARFTTAPNLVSYLGFMREQRQPTSKVELECANADLFFLDDVHAAELWPWLQRFYYNVFNKRANREKRRPGETLTFITTNEPMEDARGLTPWLSHPVADRLNMGLTLINMTGESYRSQLQGKNYHW